MTPAVPPNGSRLLSSRFSVAGKEVWRQTKLSLGFWFSWLHVSL